MPSKGTPKRGIRIGDGLWGQAKATAKERGDNLSDILRQALAQYVHDHREGSTNDQ